MSENIITPEFRVSYPSVFQPDTRGKKPKYGLTLLFPHPSKMTPAYKAEYDAFIVKLKAARDEVGREKFGAKWDNEAFRKSLRNPFRDQGEKDGEAYEAGALFMNCTSQQRPGLVDHTNQDIIEERQFYPGCYARASIRAFAYDNESKGVAFGLQNVQKLRDGDPLGGRTRAQDDFEPVAGTSAGAEGGQTSGSGAAALFD